VKIILARFDEPSNDRQSGGFNRDRQNRGEGGRCKSSLNCSQYKNELLNLFFKANMSGGGGGGSRDNQHGNDFGFGYPRSKDDRTGGGSGGRDQNRSGQRDRYQNDDNRSNSGVDRPRYVGRHSDTTRDRQTSNGTEYFVFFM
jgi:hypothetical protein